MAAQGEDNKEEKKQESSYHHVQQQQQWQQQQQHQQYIQEMVFMVNINEMNVNMMIIMVVY